MSSTETPAASTSSRPAPRSLEHRAILELIKEGIPPRVLLSHLAPNIQIPDADDETLISILISILEPPKRTKLKHYNTIQDAIELIKSSKKIIVLSGAGISTSAGLPDFRSRNGIYVQINAEHPDLIDPKYMFDIAYFRQNPLPFYRFAKALYPGQFSPTIGHKFIKFIEKHNKLLRNYTQNIDTLEKQANIERVIECHGSFAKATCTRCGHTCDGNKIKDLIMNQEIPKCPKCQDRDSEDRRLSVMKPNIVFFGEQLGEEFHRSLEQDRTEVDLLIVIGSSLKVKPVAMIPLAIDSNVPQILINKEPLDHMEFDIELLGDCDEIIQELCLRLGESWSEICKDRTEIAKEIDFGSVIKTDDSKATVGDDPTSKPKGEEGTFMSDFCADDDKKENTSADEDNWEDVEVIHDDSEDDDDSTDRIDKSPADISVPKCSYVHLKPSRYLFHGVELTKRQLKACEASRQLED